VVSFHEVEGVQYGLANENVVMKSVEDGDAVRGLMALDGGSRTHTLALVSGATPPWSRRRERSAPATLARLATSPAVVLFASKRPVIDKRM
jgi:hypothetical protein